MENRRVEVEAWPAKPNVVDAGRPDLEAVTEMTERGSDSESVGGGAGPSSSRIAVRIRSVSSTRFDVLQSMHFAYSVCIVFAIE